MEKTCILLSGRINGKPTKFLIDSGATRSFISKRCIDRLGIRVEPQKGIEVKLADDTTVPHAGIITKLRCDIAHFRFILKRLVVLARLTDDDVILGMDWLEV